MEKLLMLGTDSCSVDMIKYAKSQGVYTIVVDYWPPEKSFAKQVADESWQISIADLDAIEQKCREEGITAVICGISEFCQDMVLELCERLGLPNYATKEAWHFNRDKADFKAACKKVGAPVATDYYLTDALTDEELDAVVFPVVVKPVDKCSNQGVSFCYNKEELIHAYRYARSISDNSTIVVERLIKGDEYIAMYAIADGDASLIGLVSSYVQPGEPTNCYCVNTSINRHVLHYLDVTDCKAKSVLKEIGCKEGVAWIQFMHDRTDGNDYLIEMGYRLAGDLTFIPYTEINQFDAIKWMVECALGVKHTFQDLPEPQKEAYRPCACSYIIWTNKEGTIAEMRGLDQVSRMPGVRIVRNVVQVGDRVPCYRQICNIVFTSKDCDAMCDMIDRINHMVSILDENGNDMMIHFTDFETIRESYKLSFKQK